MNIYLVQECHSYVSNEHRCSLTTVMRSWTITIDASLDRCIKINFVREYGQKLYFLRMICSVLLYFMADARPVLNVIDITVLGFKLTLRCILGSMLAWTVHPHKSAWLIIPKFPSRGCAIQHDTLSVSGAVEEK